MSQTATDYIMKNPVSYQREYDDLPAPHQPANDSYPEESAENNKESNTSCFGRCLNRHRLEIISYLIMFSWVMVQISSTSMILEKVCLVHYNYSLEICNNLDNHTKIKSAVEKTATNYKLGHTLIQTAPAVLVSCFVGPWSDQYGRKIPMLLAITGMFLNNLGSTVCAYFSNSRVEFFFIPAIFTGCFGGVVTILTLIYSYASDVTPDEGSRTMKYAFLEMATGLSQPLGAAAGGWIFHFLGYPAVFMISAAGLTICFISIVFFLPETRGQENKDALETKLKNLCTLETLKEGFTATMKQRPNQGRKQILLLIISMCFIVIATNSTGDVSYFFAHHQYNWNNTKYSTFIAIYSAISVVILVMVVPALKYFRAGDPALGLYGTISILLKYIGIGLAWKPAVYHIASILGCLQGCASLAGRSRISKLVPSEDIGKVFSFVATAEAFLPVLTTIIISQIFNAFLEIYPGMPYIVLALCCVLPLGVFAWMTRLPNTSSELINKDNESIGETP